MRTIAILIATAALALGMVAAALVAAPSTLFRTHPAHPAATLFRTHVQAGPDTLFRT